MTCTNRLAKTSDFLFSDHGSICLLTPASETAKAWLSANVQDESANWFGNSLAIEPRYMDAIAEGIMADGLTIG